MATGKVASRLGSLAGPSALGLAEGCSGAALLLLGDPLLRSLAGESVDRRVIDVARILGTRQLVQGILTLRRPTRRTLQLGASVDAAHAATMLACAAADVGPRRLTLASSAMATVFVGAGIQLAADDRRLRMA